MVTTAIPDGAASESKSFRRLFLITQLTVSRFGQMKSMGPMSFEAAEKEFNKKFKDKSGHKWEDRSEPAKKGKYTFLERSYENDDEEDEGEPTMFFVIPPCLLSRVGNSSPEV